MNAPEYTLTTATLGLHGRYTHAKNRPTLWAYDPPDGKTPDGPNTDIYVQPFDLHGTAEEILRRYVYNGMVILAGMVAGGEGKDQEVELARLMALYPEVQRNA